MAASGGALLLRRVLIVACLVVIVIQVAGLVFLTRAGQVKPRDVPVLIAGPAVVAEPLAGEANALPGAPFRAGWIDDEDAARAAVRDGGAVAVLMVQLTGTEDVLLINPLGDRALNDAVVDQAREAEKARGRTIVVDHEVRARAADGDGAAGVRRFVLLCALLGAGYVLVISFANGPIPASLRLGVVRVAGLGAVSLAGATLLQLLPATSLTGDSLVVIGLGAGYAFVTGLLALSFESLAGLAGLAAAAASYVLFAVPLVSGISPYLLPPPWPTVWEWLPTGAAEVAVAHVSYLDPGGIQRPVLVLAGVAVSAIVLLLAARAMRGSASPDPACADGSATTDRPPARHWRLRVLGLVAPLLLVLGLVVWMLPQDPVGATVVPSTASETRCINQLQPADNVADLNREIAAAQGAPEFLGADVGATVQLQDGRFLVVFGDTLRSASFTSPRMVRNSMMLWDTDCVSVVLPPGQGALIPDRGDGVGYWPMSLAVAHQPGYDLVLVSAQRVKVTGGGSFDFANVGSALAVFVVPAAGTPQLVAFEDIGKDDADTGRPQWGAALAGAHGWLYLYGTAHPADQGIVGFSLQVARVRPLDVLEHDAWQYWDGARWQADPEQAVELIPADGGVSQTLSVFHQGGRWYALSKLGGDLSNDIAFWTAPGPTGPFTATGAVAQAPADAEAGDVTYMPLAHPELLRRKGSIVASYSRNNLDYDKVVADPSLYRPRFLRLPLPD